MNKAQKRVVLAAVAVVALMLLFPPWQRTSAGYSSIIKGASYSPPSKALAGYGFLFSPPVNAEAVDASRLAVQVGVVAVLAFGACVALSRRDGS
jgi:hypothetical protein